MTQSDYDKLDDGENVSSEVRKMVDDNFEDLLYKSPVSGYDNQIDEILKPVYTGSYDDDSVTEAKAKLHHLVNEIRIDELRQLLNDRTFEPVITPQAIQDRLAQLKAKKDTHD